MTILRISLVQCAPCEETSMSNNFEERTVDILSNLGISSLFRYLSKSRAKLISESGLEIDSVLLAQSLLIDQGLNIYKNKELRFDILNSLNTKTLSSFISDNQKNSLERFNDFRWGDNLKSRQFLSTIGIDYAEVFEDDTSKAEKHNNSNIEKPLHSYQNWVRKKVNLFLRQNIGSRTIVHMPTGAGKTRTMLESVCDHMREWQDSRQVVVWLAHSEELCEQAVESFLNLWNKLGSENAQIVRLWGGATYDSLDIDKPTFVVASFQTAANMIHTLSNQRFDIFQKIRSRCALLVVDEAHQSTAPTYQDVIELFANYSTKTVGLTATPGRHHINQDGEETKKLSNFYQNNKIDIVDDNGNDLDNPIDFLKKKGVLAQVKHFSIPGSEIELSDLEAKQMEKYLDVPSSILKKLGEDSQRTNLIVTNALKLVVDYQYPTIIFAPSKESAINISILLKLRGIEARAITSDSSKQDRGNYIAGFKNGTVSALVNFGVLTTGFDAPNIKAVIIARPTTSVVLYSQMVGRGLRGELMGGEQECYLVDVEDNIVNMPDASQAYTFFNEYY